MSAQDLTRSELASAAPHLAKAGDVLVSASLSDPNSGVLPIRSWEDLATGYEGGEYFFKIPDLKALVLQWVYLQSRYQDVSMGVDVRLSKEYQKRVVIVGCRADTAVAGSGYMLLFSPDKGDVLLVRGGADENGTTLANKQADSTHFGTASNRVELSCAGSTIEARINGKVVASVQDRTYKEGRLWLGAASAEQGVDARFKNLEVTKR